MFSSDSTSHKASVLVKDAGTAVLLKPLNSPLCWLTAVLHHPRFSSSNIKRRFPFKTVLTAYTSTKTLSYSELDTLPRTSNLVALSSVDYAVVTVTASKCKHILQKCDVSLKVQVCLKTRRKGEHPLPFTTVWKLSRKEPTALQFWLVVFFFPNQTLRNRRTLQI